MPHTKLSIEEHRQLKSITDWQYAGEFVEGGLALFNAVNNDVTLYSVSVPPVFNEANQDTTD